MTRTRFRLRLRTLLVMLGLLTFGLPFAGLALLRVYDNQLIRLTEGELVAQGAFVTAAFRHALGRQPDDGVPVPTRPLRTEFVGQHSGDAGGFIPAPPRINLLATAVHPPAPPARPTAAAPDARLRAAAVEVEPVLREAQRVTLAGIRIVDSAGTVIATTREEAGLSLIDRQEVARALDGENLTLLRQRISDEPAPPYSSLSRGTGVRVFVARPIVEHGRVLGAVVLARTPQSLGAAVYQDRRYLAATALLLLVLVFAVCLLVAALVVRPIRALIRQTEAIAAGGTLPAELGRSGAAEIAQLAAAFSRMAHALAERADYIRSLAAAISHEFKTPLAALHGTVELLREHEATMSAADRGRFLGNLAADTERLERLVRRLLELARADVATPSDRRWPVGPVLQALLARYAQAGRAIVVEATPDLAEVHMAPEVLESVLVNLIDNAHQHAGPEALVALRARNQNTAVALAVENSGQPLSRANLERIFDPFFTTARDRGGTGLGLTIARALVVGHGGKIEVTTTAQTTTFTVTLPAGAR